MIQNSSVPLHPLLTISSQRTSYLAHEVSSVCQHSVTVRTYCSPHSDPFPPPYMDEGDCLGPEGPQQTRHLQPGESHGLTTSETLRGARSQPAGVEIPVNRVWSERQTLSKIEVLDLAVCQHGAQAPLGSDLQHDLKPKAKSWNLITCVHTRPGGRNCRRWKERGGRLERSQETRQ